MDRHGTRSVRRDESACASWLCRSEMDRERMLDMDRRLAPVRRVALGVLALALLACGPWLGWWTLAPLAFAAGLFTLADRRVDYVDRPEYLIFAAWAGSQVTIAAATAVAGGPTVATLSWLAIPIVTLSARFDVRGVASGVVFTLALLVGSGLLIDAGAVGEDPTILIAPAAMIIATAMLSTALMQSDREHRSEALVDPLTGMLTRRALGERVAELAHQSRLSREPVGVIVADLDDLKEINDSRGHPAGDEALRRVAAGIRRELRAFDLAYRVGGDEFVVLLPGSDAEAAREMAERLRDAVADRRNGGTPLSISFGVDASPAGAEFDFAAVFARADDALIAAKRRADARLPVPAL
jgi:diguanylate cyclase (GGDEF)-like protein